MLGVENANYSERVACVLLLYKAVVISVVFKFPFYAFKLILVRHIRDRNRELNSKRVGWLVNIGIQSVAHGDVVAQMESEKCTKITHRIEHEDAYESYGGDFRQRLRVMVNVS